MEEISWKDFEKVALVTGTIVGVEDFPEAKKPAYKLKVDLGESFGIKNSSAQITKLYTKEELLGKQVLCVVNFPPKKIASFLSEVLVCGFVTEGGVVLAATDQKIANGLPLC
jgi:tRNA-binding protein